MSATPEPEMTVLDRFLHYADQLDALMGVRHQPAYAETCTCGASVEVGSDVEIRERRRLANHFIARHQHCAQPCTADIDLTQNGDSDERDT